MTKKPRLIRVKVSPGQSKESVLFSSEDVLKISVCEKAEGGLANTRVRELLAECFKVPISSVVLRKGAHRRSKHFFIY